MDGAGVRTAAVGPLPLACAATCAASVRVQEMGMEASVRGDLTLLKPAMLHGPLTAAAYDPEEVWQMVDELIVAQARWLPQSAAEVPAARARLAAHATAGTRVTLRTNWRGGAPLRRRPGETKTATRPSRATPAGAAADGECRTSVPDVVAVE